MKEITTVEEFKSLFQEKLPLLIFKHSTICPVSSRAYNNVETFIKLKPNCPVYLVKVVESRPLSNHIAEHFAITHQSPQVFLVNQGECVWNASHAAITEVALQEELSKVNQS